MSRRLIIYGFALLAIALIGLPVLQAQSIPVRRFFKLISSYDNDPFVEDSVVERLSPSKFSLGEDGRPILVNEQVRIEDERVIYRRDPKTGEYIAFANNPFPLPASNAAGDFRFNNEERFPRHEIERDSDGKPVLDKNGMQVWKQRDIHIGMTTAFEAANAVKEAAEYWSGRQMVWGKNGQLLINSHAFIDFNAFFSPTAQALYFGVVPYRLPGEPKEISNIKMFEMASSWEIVAHESGHVLHHAIKPNADLTDQGYRTWSESFGDQLAMWASLLDWDRTFRLLAETNGDLNQSNSLTRIGEAFAELVGQGTGLRDAFHDKKVSDTSTEIHARSQVLTGATYKIFLTVYGWLRNEYSAEESLMKAAQIMGAFLTRAGDYVPESGMTLEDVGKAYLKVDKEFFDYRYHTLLVDEFARREIFDADSVREWFDHEASRPALFLPPGWSDYKIEQMVQANIDRLGIGPNFGLKLQNVIRSNPSRRAQASEQTIVRVQLTRGRGEGAEPLDNYGILVFRASGMLADYHTPLPVGDYRSLLPETFSEVQAMAMIGQANQFSLDRRGAPLSIVRRPDGQLTVEARVMRGGGLNTYMEVFTLDNPQGERREIAIPPLPPDMRIAISENLLK